MSKPPIFTGYNKGDLTLKNKIRKERFRKTDCMDSFVRWKGDFRLKLEDLEATRVGRYGKNHAHYSNKNCWYCTIALLRVHLYVQRYKKWPTWD